ncbi:MAG: hypothetical protein U1C48_00880 [Methylotenera sp.]|nr:hypothetical protein [Methylotenera sp.]
MQKLGQGVREFSMVERRQIEDEHVRLNQFLQNLRETCDEFYSLEGCQSCDREKIASCQGRLISFEHVFLDFLIEHFKNEEKIMAGIFNNQDTNEHFLLHQQEHDNLLREMDNLMHKLSNMSERGQTVVAIREFHHRVMELFGEHFRNFDDYLLHKPMSDKK